MSLVWEKNGESFYARVDDAMGLPVWRLTTEPVGNGWTWTVRRRGEGHRVRYGLAVTSQGAMRHAERAIE